MDADKFYGTFIDKVENDIKTLYSLIYKVLLNVEENDYEGKGNK